MSRALNKAVTLYNHTGEVNYAAQYEVTIIENVYTTEKSGVVVKNDSPDDALTVYIFDRKAIAKSISGETKTYLPCSDWDALVDKSGYWTLHDDEKDVIVPGIQITVSKPMEIAMARKIVQHYRLQAGTPRMWHRKVIAK